jgi:hypothetical protein
MVHRSKMDVATSSYSVFYNVLNSFIVIEANRIILNIISSYLTICIVDILYDF